MKKISYDQARADHEYLWSIAPASDMTGAYVDQGDLVRLLESPTKATARDLYCQQIAYWFQKGTVDEPWSGEDRFHDGVRDSLQVYEIALRHGCDDMVDWEYEVLGLDPNELS